MASNKDAAASGSAELPAELPLSDMRARALSASGFAGKQQSHVLHGVPSSSTPATDGATSESAPSGSSAGWTSGRREAWLVLLDLPEHLAPLRNWSPALSTDYLAPGRVSASHAADAEVEELDATSDEAEWEVATTKRARRRRQTSAASESAARSRASSVAYNTESEASASRPGSRPANAKKRAPKKRAKAQPLSTPHRDESQVQLDVDRSFAGQAWEASVPAADRTQRRAQLTDVIRRVLRSTPALCYYQGYHDVISLLLLTLSPDLPNQRLTVAGLDGTPDVWQSAEERDMVVQASSRLSLHWLRDYMTRGLDPALGGLKLTRNMLRKVDAPLAAVVESASPLPYFALSWQITGLAHDIPPELAAQVLDYLLVDGQGGALYLTVALLVSNRAEIMAQDGSNGAELHHMLSRLPRGIDSNSLPALLQQAAAIAAEHGPLEPVAGLGASTGVMGPQSVLRTFARLRRPASAGSWRTRDERARTALAGDVRAIVRDFSVSPPPSPPPEPELQKGRRRKTDAEDRPTHDKAEPARGLLLAGALGATAIVLWLAASSPAATQYMPAETVQLIKSFAARIA